MREVKFRAWDGTGMLQVSELLLAGEGFDYRAKGDHAVSSWRSNDVLMQYTGLKDKNGLEIYEGDVIAIGLDMENCIVEWNDDRFVGRWVVHGFLTDLRQLSTQNEVIGNKYENPELLKS